MDDAGDVANASGSLDERMDRLARRNVHGRSAHLKAGIAEHFCGCICALLTQIRKQDVLARADAPRDCLTNRTCTDNNDNFVHCKLHS